ncbi:Putative Holin-X, holin superfamily III [Plantibacter flavus]|uniref:Putative superfamily III holin-X n=2 Tax=Plantibacter flavus TaxID=150123 RepID=A0A3N2BZ03_9MICO|nr:putative superfamily III holin-X [Plantibacter flavus]SMG34161.1 Putative Holin-X, holin superfamily III [Plantibacter flavus]
MKTLLADLREDVVRLVTGEIALFKAEMTKKAKDLGIGAGMLVVALVLVLFGFGTLIAAAVLGLATVLPAWLAALIVGVVLILVAGILALVGVKKLKAGAKPVPERSVEALTGDHLADQQHDSKHDTKEAAA